MQIRPLSGVPMSDITTCFNEAFANYFVPIQVNEAYLQRRWYGAKADYNYSFGAFDGDKLVGFIIFAIDERNGQRTAHNLATGVLPAYRRQNIIPQIYELAVPLFHQQGVSKLSLEVITNNIAAIKAYQQQGYTIDRLLYCYSGHITREEMPAHPFRITRHPDIDQVSNHPLNKLYFSWDNSSDTIQRLHTDYECWQLNDQDELKAFALINPATGYMAQYGFATGGEITYGLPLFHAIGGHYPKVSITNLDSRYQAVKELFDQCGLSNHINQFEMQSLL
jgi:ribosomal protein S18 acetylase RimI-like enzyme